MHESAKSLEKVRVVLLELTGLYLDVAVDEAASVEVDKSKDHLSSYDARLVLGKKAIVALEERGASQQIPARKEFRDEENCCGGLEGEVAVQQEGGRRARGQNSKLAPETHEVLLPQVVLLAGALHGEEAAGALAVLHFHHATVAPIAEALRDDEVLGAYLELINRG